MNERKRAFGIAIATAVLFMLSVVASATGGASDRQVLELLVIEAVTPQKHVTAAEFYDAKARDAREEAARHRRMGELYAGGVMGDRQSQKAHCERIASLHVEMAEEYEILALNHRAEAEAQAAKRAPASK